MTSHDPSERTSSSANFDPGSEVARAIQRERPLAAGLRACAEECRSRSDRTALRRMADRLEAGIPVEDVISQEGGLPVYLDELIAAGIRTGNLASLLADYLTLARQRCDLQHQMFLAVFYPMVILLVLLTIGSIMPLWIIPQFKDLFYSFGLELPTVTRRIIDLADLVRATWPLLLGLLLLFVINVVGHRNLPGRGFRQRLVKLIPLVGSAMHFAALSEFSTLLSVLIRARIDLPEALLILSQSLDDRSLRGEARMLGVRMSNGESIDDLVDKSKLPPELLHLRCQFAGTQELADQLRLFGQVYAAQAEVKLRQALILLEPAMICLIAIGVGGLMLSVFIPLFKLLNDLS